MPHHIKLQSSIGDFDAAFLNALPALEQAMRAHGIDPAGFIIAKDATRGPLLPIFYRPGGSHAEYTVFVKGQSFSVVQPDDASFLAYFHGLFAHEPEPDDPHSLAHAVHSAEHKLTALIGRLAAWGNKPI